ncbi:ERF superfamily [Streptococcus pneumoniae]|nr:ERF superfamily [Streptococcus pneumoniae]
MKLTYLWINADKPEEQLEVSFYSVGQQDDVSKAHGTALTYAERYFLMKFFNIPTDEDDADAKQKQEMYSKPNVEKVGELKKDILSFINLMKERGSEITEEQVKKELNITDYTKLSNSQIANAIQNLKAWSK